MWKRLAHSSPYTSHWIYKKRQLHTVSLVPQLHAPHPWISVAVTFAISRLRDLENWCEKRLGLRSRERRIIFEATVILAWISSDYFESLLLPDFVERRKRLEAVGWISGYCHPTELLNHHDSYKQRPDKPCHGSATPPWRVGKSVKNYSVCMRI